ncbi:YidB family protein [Faucicola mancuniensis]|uniref:YidB family protein n=1 Tax=Faucicola mancuniensis TaxID=1309795 RepID=UPI0039772BEB
MSLLTNLITQVAQSAMQGQQPQQQQPQNSGLGGMLGSVLGGGQSSGVNLSDGFGLDDLIGMAGMAMNQNQPQVQSQGNVLGQVLGSVLGGQSGGNGGKSALMVALLPLALNFIQQNGGLSGALGKVQNMGFGQQANSWMSANQPNQSLNPNDITQLFGQQQIQQVAQQTGCGEGEVCQGMADLLPQVFDQLTPDGDTNKEAEANNEINEILSQVSRFIR